MTLRMNNNPKRNLMFMIALLIAMMIITFTTSCNSYIGERTSRGCGVWYPKKFEKDRSFNHYRERRSPRFGRH